MTSRPLLLLGLLLAPGCVPKWSPPASIDLHVPVDAAHARTGTAVPVGRQDLIEYRCADARIAVERSGRLLLHFIADVVPEDVGTSTSCSVVLDKTGAAEMDVHFVRAVAQQ